MAEINSTILIDKDFTNLVFIITNYEHFCETFPGFEHIERSIASGSETIIDDSGTQHCLQLIDELKQIIEDARKTKTIKMCLTPGYSDTGIVIFDFKGMKLDVFGTLYLEYEFATTAS